MATLHLVTPLIFVSILSCASAYSHDFYTAAVFEHSTWGNLSVHTLEDIVQTNLAYFRNAATVARSKEADIIVFPEYGIFPFCNRTTMKEVLEYIPDPKINRTNPCEETELYSERPILKELSCIARDNSMVVVANMGDIQPCRNETGCPDDGTFHFNTNVAFDSDGTLIGRYHKERLFFEIGMDLPRVPQDPTFVTQFGKFAMFICFDVVFKHITEAAEQGVEAVLLPTMWIDPTPFMTSVQLWQSWAMANNATFIAANVQIPGYFAVGSGLFNGKGAIAYTYNPDGKSKLIVANVPRKHSYSGSYSNTSESSITVITFNGTEEYDNDGINVPLLCSRKILGESKDIYRDYRCLEEDTSNYTFVKLNGSEGHVKACNNDLCCSLNYTAVNMYEDYYLGVYNGTYNMFDRYFWCEENCLLARCDAFDDRPCSTFPMRTKTKFRSVHLSANITAERIYPSVLGDGIRLIPTTHWRYGKVLNETFVNFENALGKEILVVGLNGRCYDKDPPYIR